MFIAAMVSAVIGSILIIFTIITYGARALIVIPATFLIALSVSIITWLATPKAIDLSRGKLKMKVINTIKNGIEIRKDTTYTY